MFSEHPLLSPFVTLNSNNRNPQALLQSQGTSISWQQSDRLLRKASWELTALISWLPAIPVVYIMLLRSPLINRWFWLIFTVLNHKQPIFFLPHICSLRRIEDHRLRCLSAKCWGEYLDLIQRINGTMVRTENQGHSWFVIFNKYY
jgi:hypothetical protein